MIDCVQYHRSLAHPWQVIYVTFGQIFKVLLNTARYEFFPLWWITVLLYPR
jgi:hypothetical protein